MNLIDSIASQASLARFASFVYTKKSDGSTSRYTIQLGFNYRNLVEKSLLQLKIESRNFTGIKLLAANELLESFWKTMNGTQDAYTKAETYVPDLDSRGLSVQGVKRNLVDETWQIFGLLHSKVEILPPTLPAKVVKSSEKTIEKNKLRHSLPIGKFVEFALENLTIAKINGETLELE